MLKISVFAVVLSLAWATPSSGVLVASPTTPQARAELPKPPAGAVKIRVQPLAQCGPETVVYQEMYDVNPATAAAFAYYGKAVRGADGSPSFEPPIAAALADDEGNVKYFTVEDGLLVTRTAQEFAYHHGNQWCNLIQVGERASR